MEPTKLMTSTVKNPPSEPLFDDYLGRVSLMMGQGVEQETKGFYKCGCGAKVKKKEVIEANQYVITSLMMHHILVHRDEVSKEDLKRIVEASEKYNKPGKINPDAVAQGQRKKKVVVEEDEIVHEQEL